MQILKGKYVVNGKDVTDEKVIIPDTVTMIADKAFKGNNNIKEVFIPDTVTHIGREAFSSCEKLETISLSKNIREINPSTFSNCKSLKKIVLPKKVVSIAEGAFSSCTSLQTIQWSSENLRFLGAEAFSSCHCLLSIPPLTYIKTLNDKTFYKCHSLEFVVLGNVSKIGKQCFHATKIGKIKLLLEDIEELGESAFEKCRFLRDIVIHSSKIKVIPSRCFYGCENLKQCVLPDTITTLEDECFAYTALEEVTIATTMTKLGEEVFSSCKQLQNVFWKSTHITKIPDHFFANCSNLEKVQLPDMITEIGNYSFKSSGITSFEFPKELYTIRESAFDSCSSLQSITLPPNITTIEDSAFAFSGLKSIHLPKSLKNLGKSCFFECKQLKIALFEEGLSYIPTNCFESNSSLEFVILSQRIRKIEKKAFSKCENLKAINLENTSIEVIEGHAFSYCENLLNVIFPLTLKEIQQKAFYECNSLTMVKLPNPVILEDFCFASCSHLTTVINVPKIFNKTMFEACYSLQKFIVEENASWKEIMKVIYLNLVYCMKGKNNGYF